MGNKTKIKGLKASDLPSVVGMDAENLALQVWDMYDAIRYLWEEGKIEEPDTTILQEMVFQLGHTLECVATQSKKRDERMPEAWRSYNQ